MNDWNKDSEQYQAAYRDGFGDAMMAVFVIIVITVVMAHFFHWGA